MLTQVSVTIQITPNPIPNKKRSANHMLTVVNIGNKEKVLVRTRILQKRVLIVPQRLKITGKNGAINKTPNGGIAVFNPINQGSTHDFQDSVKLLV